jgi:hypothetical protein
MEENLQISVVSTLSPGIFCQPSSMEGSALVPTPGKASETFFAARNNPICSVEDPEEAIWICRS